MERQPQKAPLPCYGLEHDRYDPQCQECPHYEGCRVFMGSRLDKVPLDKVKFDIVPEEFSKDALEMDDPELPHLQRLYCDCFASVFRKNPADNVSQYRKIIAVKAQQAQCSVRMFMLANMVAHSIHEQQSIEHTEKAFATRFRAKLLTGELAVKRAKMYQEMCHDRFGTFSLKSLSVLTDDEDKPELANTMLRSELTAAKWVVRFKVFNGGPVETALYDSEELQLDPEWLAIEETYINTILKPYINREIRGSDAVERHRFNTVQVHGHYKRHLRDQKLAWLTRQSIMPEVVRQVLTMFNHGPADFLYPRIAIRKPVEFWKALGLTIRHYHCWLYLNGMPSYFTPRRLERLEAHL